MAVRKLLLTLLFLCGLTGAAFAQAQQEYLIVGNPTGGYEGTGSVNVSKGYYVNGVLVGSSGVVSVGNAAADTSLNITGTGSGPYTGAVTVALNTANANIWTAPQTFTNGDLLMAGSASGVMTLEAPAAASNYIQTFQATTDTVVDKATTDILTNKTLASTTDVLGGVTTTLGSDATGDMYYRNSSGVLTRLPVCTGTNVIGASAGLPACVAVSASSITVGVTSILSGINTLFLYQSGSTLGETAAASWNNSTNVMTLGSGGVQGGLAFNNGVNNFAIVSSDASAGIIDIGTGSTPGSTNGTLKLGTLDAGTAIAPPATIAGDPCTFTTTAFNFCGLANFWGVAASNTPITTPSIYQDTFSGGLAVQGFYGGIWTARATTGQNNPFSLEFVNAAGVVVAALQQGGSTNEQNNFQIGGQRFSCQAEGCATQLYLSDTYADGKIASVGAITAGSSYTDGTYTNVPLTAVAPSHGQQAFGTVVVSGGGVTSVTITFGGLNFVATTDSFTASAANIGGTGSGFSAVVGSVTSPTTNVGPTIFWSIAAYSFDFPGLGMCDTTSFTMCFGATPNFGNPWGYSSTIDALNVRFPAAVQLAVPNGSTAYTCDAQLIAGGSNIAKVTQCNSATLATFDAGIFNGALGSTTPAAAAVTTLSVTGAVTVAVRTASSTTDNISATTDYMVCADNSGGAATENLPGSPATGLTFLIKDCGGNAATHNITVTPASGNIDGAASFVMSTAYQSAAVTYTGSQWSLN